MFEELRYTLVYLLFLLFSANALGQCGSGTPVFNVDLSNDPNAIWMSPDTNRIDTCCGAIAPDKCVAFVVTLHPLAEGIIFDICDGAIPPGAIFYQVNCGSPTAVGEALCLTGVGPHYITFCKPGNNSNKYCITSIAEPIPGPNAAINDGCEGTLWVAGYDPAVVNWTSVYPGAIGAYNSYLDCTSGCDTVHVTGQSNAPDTVMYEVCGTLIGDCDTGSYCDTIMAFFFSSLQAVISPEDPTVCFGAAGTYLYAGGAGGSPPYNYEWSTNDTTDSIFVNVGTYYLTVWDTSGCPPAMDTVVVNAFASTILAFAGQDSIVCLDFVPYSLAGSVQAASGGRWIGAGGTFVPDSLTLNATYLPSSSELSNGQSELYLITTGNGTCPPDTDTIVLNWHDFDAFSTFQTMPVSCFGGTDGLAFLLSSASAPLSVQWNSNPVQFGDTATGLAAGSYSVLVTDSFGCDSLYNVTVAQPSILIMGNPNITNVSCNGGANGSIAASVSGGTSPYVFSWSTAATGSSIGGLSAATYTVTVTDNNGCTITASYTLTEPAAATISFVLSNVSCNGGANGAITVLPSGTFGTVTYVWSNSSSSQIATSLTAGVYTVTVSYGSSCTMSGSATITQPAALSLSLSQNNISCNGMSNGTIGTSVSGGTTNYTYSWSNATTASNLSGVAAGTYTVIVTDAHGCTISASLELTQPSVLTVSASATNVSCNGFNDGFVNTTTTGGTAAYSFLWSNNGTGVTASALAPGTYTVTVTDNNGCTSTDSVIISEPAVLNFALTITNVDCFGNSSGSIGSNASGGTANYNYSWSNSDTVSSISSLIAGTYTLTLTDANNCSVSASATITQPDSIFVQLSSTDITCHGDNDGSITTQVTGGTLPYDFLWSNTSTSSAQNGLSPGNYTLTLTDFNDCEFLVSATIIEPDLIWINGVPTDVSCKDFNNGTIVTSATGGVGAYLYQWSNAATSATISGLSPGAFTITVTDENNCEHDTTFSITEPDSLLISLTHQNVTCFAGSDGWIATSVNGGTTPYSFNWNNSTAGDSALNIPVGGYVITVTDFRGCTSTASVTLTSPSIISLTMSSEQEICLNTSAQIEAIAAGGNGGYVYSWSDGLPNSSVHTVSPIVTTIYHVSITDTFGCPPAIGSVRIKVKPVVFGPLNVTINPDIICSGEQAIVNGSYGGSLVGYQFFWSQGLGNASGQFIVSPEASTTYALTVMDGCGFTIEDSATLVVNPTPLLNVPEIIDEGCAPFTKTFSIDAGGVNINTYAWQFGNGISSSDASPTNTYNYPGTFKVKVFLISDKGCKSSGNNEGIINVWESPTADFEFNPDHLDTDNPTTRTINLSEGAITYTWITSDGAASADFEITHTFAEYGEYFFDLTAVNEYGCKDTARRTIIVDPVLVFEFPDAFTPNLNFQSDGFYDPSSMNNDIFYLITAYVSEFRFLVFNRWGEIVFETFDSKQGWNGYYRNELAPIGMYVWRADITFVTGKQVTQVGNVTLLR